MGHEEGLGEVPMIHFLSQRMASFLQRRSIVPEEDKPVYTYGIELLISSLLGLVLILLAGLLLGAVNKG